MELGLSTHAEECASLTGTDWDSKLPQIAYEQKVLKEIGLISDAPVADGQPPEPRKKDDESD